LPAQNYGHMGNKKCGQKHRGARRRRGGVGVVVTTSGGGMVQLEGKVPVRVLLDSKSSGVSQSKSAMFAAKLVPAILAVELAATCTPTWFPLI